MKDIFPLRANDCWATDVSSVKSRALINRIFSIILLILLAATLEGKGAAAVYSWPPAKGTLLVANSYDVTAYSNQHGGGLSPLAVTPDMAYVSGIARDSTGRIYVTNEATNTVTVYPSGSNGNVEPLAVIGGSNTKLASPERITLDAAGQIYVVNSTNYPKGTINVYPPLGAETGIINEAPIAIIAGNKTGLNDPSAVAVDSEGRIYVTNEIGGPRVKGQKLDVGSVTIYSLGANGNVKPIAIIQGAATRLSFPACIALDSAGNIYVANFDTANVGDNFEGGSVTVYAANSNGDAAPIALITGPDTALSDTGMIALDPTGNIYVSTFVDNANYQGNGVNVYPAASDGNVAPALTIAGSGTSLTDPSAFTLDGTGNLYVSNYGGGPNGGGSVIVFPPASSGDAVPETVITSSFIGLDSPSGIAAGAGNIFVSNEFGGSNGQGSVSFYPIANYATTPEVVITGSDTGLDYPFGIASDSSGNLAVLNSNNTLTEYTAGSSGDALPNATISFDANGKSQPVGLAMDSRDRIYLLNATLKQICSAGFCFSTETGAGSVAVYRPNSDGEAKPSATLAGPNIGISSPSAIAADPNGNVYVANQGPMICPKDCSCYPVGSGSITIYSSGANGDAVPSATISGPNTGLVVPYALTVDPRGNIYALNNTGFFEACVSFGNPTTSGNARVRPSTSLNDPILMFPAGSDGNVAPIAIIGGPYAGLFGSSSIAFSPGFPPSLSITYPSTL